MPTATDPPSKPQEAMVRLTAQWYNAVVDSLQLDPMTFQLVQSSQPLGTTSEVLWKIADTVPPLSVTNLLDSSKKNIFSENYGAVIHNLEPYGLENFKKIMGDYYSLWVDYCKKSPTMPPGGKGELFKNWAYDHLEQLTLNEAYTAYLRIIWGVSVVPDAVEKWHKADVGGTKAYNQTINMLQDALKSKADKTVRMDSNTRSSDVSKTWAEGRAEGACDFFSGCGSAQYNSLATKIAKSHLVIDAIFESFVEFPLGPLENPVTDPILSGYEPWYSSAALEIAYQHDVCGWKDEPPNWKDTFGPDGNLRRAISALYVIDGTDITMTSDALLTAEDAALVKTAAEAGYWPFYKAGGSGGWMNQQVMYVNGVLVITSSSPASNPIVLGAKVRQIRDIC